jgi:hypothetical protein
VQRGAVQYGAVRCVQYGKKGGQWGTHLALIVIAAEALALLAQPSVTAILPQLQATTQHNTAQCNALQHTFRQHTTPLCCFCAMKLLA